MPVLRSTLITLSAENSGAAPTLRISPSPACVATSPRAPIPAPLHRSSAASHSPVSSAPRLLESALPACCSQNRPALRRGAGHRPPAGSQCGGPHTPPKKPDQGRQLPFHRSIGLSPTVSSLKSVLFASLHTRCPPPSRPINRASTLRFQVSSPMRSKNQEPGTKNKEQGTKNFHPIPNFSFQLSQFPNFSISPNFSFPSAFPLL